ncbi:hypothetical protein FB451DRAFT_1403785 [Mycena latifolia]|nr:hypothetical protein FB451DRAFT_1403785 [Mycena latifolia]
MVPSSDQAPHSPVVTTFWGANSSNGFLSSGGRFRKHSLAKRGAALKHGTVLKLVRKHAHLVNRDPMNAGLKQRRRVLLHRLKRQKRPPSVSPASATPHSPLLPPQLHPAPSPTSRTLPPTAAQANVIARDSGDSGIKALVPCSKVGGVKRTQDSKWTREQAFPLVDETKAGIDLTDVGHTFLAVMTACASRLAAVHHTRYNTTLDSSILSRIDMLDMDVA